MRILNDHEMKIISGGFIGYTGSACFLGVTSLEAGVAMVGLGLSVLVISGVGIYLLTSS